MVIENFVEHVVKLMVAEPDAVSVETRSEREGLTVYVRVAPNDVGKMIGKNGRVISALRQVTSAASGKARKRAFVKVITED